ncbi:AlbA family DNA-binding domain-containing protein [Clostridium tertium]|uniref:AlbA family DNA-binding domain-containing protein n=1 Tax=Clostridium tertium TaxID=1559 RepID=UPI001C1E8164|nr:ATP-binding protein [Clostridium tertium]MBU6134017.1 ATP-binding protein [Clostridium tertium]
MDYEFIKKIKRIISENKEGDYWDYKQVWHKENERLLHDIICFANTAHDKDCYIIFGVSDNGDIIGINEENRKKQADVIDLISNSIFAGDNSPKIELRTIFIDEKELDILIIFNSNTVPYYLKSVSKKYKNLKENNIYTRIGDKNTPINQNSNIQDIEMLWKKRFGLTKPLINQIMDKLDNKFEWDYYNYTYYNIFNPNFKFKESEYDNNNAEFYVFSQTNSNFNYSNFKIIFNNTIIDEIDLVTLDGGRYKTPIPNKGFVGYDEYRHNIKYNYRYFLKSGIEHKIQNFLYNEENEEEVYAKNKFDNLIIYYENEDEKKEFENYIENNQDIVEKYKKEFSEKYFNIDKGDDLEKSVFKDELITALALKYLFNNKYNLY